MTFKLCRHRPRRGRGQGHGLYAWRHRAAALARYAGAALLAVVVALHPQIAYAAPASRHAVLIIDANTGQVIYQRSADAPRFPASLTKLMTLYLIFEALEQGRLSLDTKVRFSANAVAAPPSRLEVEEGTEISISDAIKALIVKSANDVAIAVAEHLAGSEERFAELMTLRAKELGMAATEFRNASGLTEEGQITTARDMTTLALALFDRFPKHFPLFATKTFSWSGDTYRNHNRLLFSYRGLDGMKTGYTRASGFNLVASARRGKKHVLVAYFGGKTSVARNAAVRTHLDAGFAKASVKRTRRPAPLVIAQAKAPPPLAVPRPEPARAPARVEQPQEQDEDREQPPVRDATPPTPPQPAPAAAAEEEETEEAAASERDVFQIQIGAFHTKAEAARQLALAREQAATVLASHAARMSEVKRGDKVLYRARYVGFGERSSAAGACSALKRLEIDCLVLRAD